MIAELQQAVAKYAHALDELNVPELEAVLTEDTTWTLTMLGQGVLGPVAGRAAVLDFIRDGYTAQTGRVRHHLGNAVVTTTTDTATAEVRAYLVQTNTGESIQDPQRLGRSARRRTRRRSASTSAARRPSRRSCPAFSANSGFATAFRLVVYAYRRGLVIRCGSAQRPAVRHQGGRVDVWVKRPDGADYDDALPMASAVRASPRSQAWAWSVS